MKKMKQAIKRVVVYLLLGFLMSWLVAWGLAMLPRVYSFGFQDRSGVFLRENEPPWGEQIIVINTRWVGAEEYQFFSMGRLKAGLDNYSIVPTYSRHIWWIIAPKHSSIENQYEWHVLNAKFSDRKQLVIPSSYSILRYGFPYLSHEVRALSERTNTPSGLTTLPTISGGFCRKIPSSAAPLRNISTVPFARYIYLPFFPIWRGLLYNTLFYALIFFTLISTKQAFRHARRLRKGKCPICNYDLRFDNTLGCPECGWRKEPSTTRSS